MPENCCAGVISDFKQYGYKKGKGEVRKGSWKKREVGKSDMKSERMKLERTHRSWKVRTEAGKINRSWKLKLI